MIVNDELMEKIIYLSFLKVLKLCNIQPTCNPVYKKNLICSFDRVSSDSILVLYHGPGLPAYFHGRFCQFTQEKQCFCHCQILIF